jgi:hypothetical protein
MPDLRSLRTLPTMACACVLAIGCGDDKRSASDESADDRKLDAPEKSPEPVPEPEAATAVEPVEDDWGDMPALDDTEGEDDTDEAQSADDTGEAQAPAEPWPGPCAIRWSSGTQVRFEYADDRSKGSVRIDLDGDRRSDICGQFELSDGKTTKVQVDEGCNRKFELEIVPSYDAKSNLATARYSTGGEPKTITLITMPAFGGLDPGYPLHAARKDIDLKIRSGLVRSAFVKAPHAGPPTRVTLTYDKAGRLTRLDEDQDDNGTVDRRFNYTYDDVGNVTRITFRFGEGDDEQKGNARLDYACWTNAD